MSGSQYRLQPQPRQVGQPNGLETVLGQVLGGKLTPEQLGGYYFEAQGDRALQAQQYGQQMDAYNLMAQGEAEKQRQLQYQESRDKLRGSLAPHPGSISMLAPELVAPGQGEMAQQYANAGLASENAQALQRAGAGVQSLSQAGWQAGGIDPATGLPTGGYSFQGPEDVRVAGINQGGATARHNTQSADSKQAGAIERMRIGADYRLGAQGMRAADTAYNSTMTQLRNAYANGIDGKMGVQPSATLLAQWEAQANAAREAARSQYSLQPSGGSSGSVRDINASFTRQRQEAMSTLQGADLDARLAEISSAQAAAVQGTPEGTRYPANPGATGAFAGLPAPAPGVGQVAPSGPAPASPAPIPSPANPPNAAPAAANGSTVVGNAATGGDWRAAIEAQGGTVLKVAPSGRQAKVRMADGTTRIIDIK